MAEPVARLTASLADRYRVVRELGEHGALTRVTTDGRRNDVPRWTPNGEAISYLSPDGGWHVRSRRPDGTGDVTNYPAPRGIGEIEDHHWSPDGRWLVLRTRVTDRLDVFAQRVGTDSVIPIAATADFIETSPALSPDGRWIAYASNESGRSEIYLRPFPDAARERRHPVAFPSAWSAR